jgi:hypothetical protein
MSKNLVRIFVDIIYKIGCLEGSGVPVLYIGRLLYVKLQRPTVYLGLSQ